MQNYQFVGGVTSRRGTANFERREKKRVACGVGVAGSRSLGRETSMVRGGELASCGGMLR